MQKVDYSRKWWVMIAVAPGVFLATIDGSIVNIALPNLVQDLHVPLSVVEWVVLAYLIAIVALILSVGRLSDMIGRKRLYVAGVVIFTLGSLLNGISPTVYWLIGFRVFQAIGAALTQVLGIAIAVNAFPREERGKLLGVMGGLVSIGVIAGPAIGGLILGALSWHWLFFVNLPVGVVGFFLARRFIPLDRRGSRQTFDFLGAGLMVIALTSFLLALTIGQNAGFTSAEVIALFAVMLVGLYAFIKVEQKAPQPMLDLSLFSNGFLNINLATCFIEYLCYVGTIVLLPFYLENMRGFSAERAGLMISVLPVAAGAVSLVSGRLSDRFGTRLLTTIGLALEVVGLALIAHVGTNTTTLGFILRSLPFGVGSGLFSAPNSSAIMSTAKSDDQGVVSGLLTLDGFLGITAGIALFTAIWTGEVGRFAGFPITGGATTAPLLPQIEGLDATLYFVLGLAVIGLGLCIYLMLPISNRISAALPAVSDPADPPDPPDSPSN